MSGCQSNRSTYDAGGIAPAQAKKRKSTKDRPKKNKQQGIHRQALLSQKRKERREKSLPEVLIIFCGFLSLDTPDHQAPGCQPPSSPPRTPAACFLQVISLAVGNGSTLNKMMLKNTKRDTITTNDCCSCTRLKLLDTATAARQ